ncbi:MAG: dTMP kinase [Candidatus Hydrothermarchaeota archaeon]
MFIVFEGIDGCGKATQAALLEKWLREEKGLSTFLTKEPTEGKIGKIIKEDLKIGDLDPVSLSLLFAADRFEHTKIIKKNLEEGKIVISERYVYSSMAYQSASGVNINWIETINNFVVVPEIIILLDIPAETGLKRIESRKKLECFEKIDFLEKVRKIYLEMLKKYRNMIKIDANRPIEEVHFSIVEVVNDKLFNSKGKTIGKRLDEYLVG